MGPAFLTTGLVTIFTAAEGHQLASLLLADGDYIVEAAIHFTNVAPTTTVSTLTCTWAAGSGVTLLNGQPPVVKEQETNLRDDVVRIPSGAVRISGTAVSLDFSCSTSSTAGLSMQATILATRVSVATVQ